MVLVRDRTAIAAEGLSKRFGRVRALESVDLEVKGGTVLALLGPNGAGKTTTVRILTALLRPDAGRAWVEGFDVVERSGEVRRRIGLSGQYAAVDPFLTGGENLRMIGRLYGLGRREARGRAEELLEAFDLRGSADRAARTYSGGMRRRLDVAASLVSRPRVMFLDEPTTGLDPHGRIALWCLLEELAELGTTLLLTTQDMEEAERLADTLMVVDHGRVIAVGTAEELKAMVGGDRLELWTRPSDDPRRLAAALEGLGTARPVVDVRAGRVVLPVNDGPRILIDLAGRLASSGLGVADLALRRPSLEDVFLALTNQPGAETAQRERLGPDPLVEARSSEPVTRRMS
ncbi:MAG TPA: ATP-binding cassette domain-containing protein [Solirubrobacterales bacterium]